MTSFHPSQSGTNKPYVDPLTRSYETYKPSGIGDPIKYREYKPNNIGIYGEKKRERKVKTPPRKPAPPRTFVKKPRDPVVRFQHYGKPTGPDIRVSAMGPDYKPPPHKPTVYKPSQPLVFKNAFKEDPLRHRASYMAKYKPSEASQPHTYRLTEENHAPYRFWKFGHVTDTVTSGPQDVIRKQHTVKHVPEETKTKKTFSNSSTQSTVTVTKNVPTQTNNNNNRTAMTQTTPLPPIDVVPVTAFTRETKRNQKTIGTQYSPPYNTPVYPHPLPPHESKRTTPVAKGSPSPRHVTPDERQRRSPSPPVTAFVPVVASSNPPRNRQSPFDQRTKTPVQATPDDLQRKTPSPLVASQPPSNDSMAPSSWEPAKSFTSVPTQSRLPPEISAHIEAYDFVHTHGEARSSIQRTMRFI